jgi:tetratricopeptide (TPR) repeat protein
MPAYTPMELANAFIRTGELADALDALNDQLNQHPDDTEAKRLRAAVRLRIGDAIALAEAHADLESLLDKTTGDYVQLSLLAERQNDLPTAIIAIEAACQLAPDDARLYERLVGLSMKQGDYVSALARVRQQPADWRWGQWEGDICIKMGDYAGALEAYHRVVQQLDERFDVRANQVVGAIRTRVLMACGFACRRSGRYDLAELLYDDAEGYYPDETAIPFNRGLIKALRGDLDTAERLCRTALDATDNAMLKDEMLTTLRNEVDLQPLAARLNVV